LFLAFSTFGRAQTYCEPEPFTYPEPICSVAFADLVSTTAGDIDSTTAWYVDNSAFVAHLERAETYTLQMTGNTDGYDNVVNVFFDWDADGVFETRVWPNALEESACDVVLPIAIAVPNDAALATTRMRLVKSYTESDGDDGCTHSSMFGSIQDFSVEVADANVGITEAEAPRFRVYPNPSTGTIFLTSSATGPVDLRLLDAAGRLVHAEQVNIRGTHPLTLPGTLARGCYQAILTSGGQREAVRLLLQ
ncbi:MAG TPA: GEVED domain-containing protein, partial [Flavobacteriales bacterium]|jgi:hypothetical protein|nr:GEVED domain-containing protein [Flavobacteriales bacterium]